MCRGLCLLFLLLLPYPVAAQNWTAVARHVDQSLSRMSRPARTESDDIYSCTGFSINQIHGYFLTAAHCVGTGLTVDATPATTIIVDEALDIALVMVDVHKPALKPASEPQKGDPVAAVGYGNDLSVSLFRTGVVSAPRILLSAEVPGEWLMVSTPFIQGMSGGPVVDAHGHLVSIIQRGDPYSGVGRPMADIVKATAQYWP